MAQREIIELLKKDRLIGIQVYSTQREIANKLDLCIGTVNRCIIALVKIGLVEERIVTKSRYVYRFVKQTSKETQHIVSYNQIKHNIYTDDLGDTERTNV